jgi:hypothetical protein
VGAGRSTAMVLARSPANLQSDISRLALPCPVLCCDVPCRAVLCCGQVYNKVLSWPPPIPGSNMCLPIGAGVINARLPHFCIVPPPQPTVDPAVQVGVQLGVQRPHRGLD